MNSFSKFLALILVIMALSACESAQIDVLGDQSEESVSTTKQDNVVPTPAAPTPTDVPAEVTKAKVYGDIDGDGYSPAQGNDCDENNPKVHKFADEICDGIDNDCDGHVDEDMTQQLFTDADKDGYGLPNAATSICIGATPPKGLVTKGGDCNDSSADKNGDGKVDGFWIHADATETCDDGIDNDCDSKTDEGCAIRESSDLLIGDNSALVVVWPSDKVGQKIMALPYYAQADIGKDWIWFQESINSIVFTLVPDGNACGVRFNTAHGKPANQWLCMDDKINPDAMILVIKADGSVVDVTKLVKKWPAPEGGCSVNLELHACK